LIDYRGINKKPASLRVDEPFTQRNRQKTSKPEESRDLMQTMSASLHLDIGSIGFIGTWPRYRDKGLSAKAGSIGY
jgi:hypothetical protein